MPSRLIVALMSDRRVPMILSTFLCIPLFSGLRHDRRGADVSFAKTNFRPIAVMASAFGHAIRR